jgi:hypothetical protein
MPQFVGFVVVVALIYCIVPIIVQYILAAILWVLQAILLPLLMSFPTIAVLMLALGFFVASFAAASNYLEAINRHIRPEHAPSRTDGVGLFIRGSLVLVLGGAAAIISLGQLGGFGYGAYVVGSWFVEMADAYFAAINWPGFKFWCPCFQCN